MWDVSDRWDDALRTSHTITTRAEVWQNGVFQQTINLSGGSITIDESSNVRRTLTLSCTDIGLEPKDAADLLSPFGSDLRLYSGVTYTEGDSESVPVGTFRIASSVRESVLSGLDITADDYSKPLSDDRFLAPWNTPQGSKIVDEIARMAHIWDASLPVYDLTGSAATTTKTTWDQDRWGSIQSLASSIGCEAIFDQTGNLIVRPVPQISSSSSSVWTIDAGNETAVMTDVATGLSNDDSYNAVVASSSAVGSKPISAIAYQTTGPLAYRTGFKKPRFYASPQLLTKDACKTAAVSILARSAIFTRQISPSSVPNPALDCGDIVLCALLDGTSELRVITRIQLDLGLNSMQIDTRLGVDYTVTNDADSLD